MYTENELAGMDYDLIFKDGDKIIMSASNGTIEDKYLLLDEDNQDELWDYFWNTGHKSKYTVSQKSLDKYPIIDSFTKMAEIGLYSYDMNDLVATPTNPISYKNLPKNIQDMLTQF
jgi:hypothetical protein